MNEQARKELKRKMREMLESRLDAMADAVGRFEANPAAVTFRDLEKLLNTELDRAGDDISGEILKTSIQKTTVTEKAVDACKKNTGSTTGGDGRQSSSSTEKP